MSSDNLHDHRQKAIILQEEEFQLALKAQSFIESNPTRAIRSMKILQSEILEFLKKIRELHDEISELIREKPLGEIQDISRIEQIIMIQQQLVELSRNHVQELMKAGAS